MIRGLAACLVGLGSLASSPPAKPTLAQAQHAYGEGDFAVALRLASSVEVDPTREGERAQLQLFRGECHAAMGAATESEEDFRQALSSDPEVALDPGRFAADLVERLNRIRSSLRGTLAVSTHRGAIRVRLDARDVGLAPFRSEVPIGRHQVEASLAGGPWVERSVLVRPDRTAEVVLDGDALVPGSGARDEVHLELPLPAPAPSLVPPIAALAGGAAGLLGAGVVGAILASDRGAEVAWSYGSYAGPTPSSGVVAGTRQRVTIEAIVTPALAVLGTAAVAWGIHLLVDRVDGPDPGGPAPVLTGAEARAGGSR